MNSPTSSEYSLRTDDDWDMIISASEPSSSVPASPLTLPPSVQSDAEFETDQDITDIASEVSSQPSDIEDPDLLGERILDADDSDEDERVNEALAQSLSSTLEPLRMPLSSTNSLPSFAIIDTPVHSNALKLSFPDPLTASNESTLAFSAPILPIEQEHRAIEEYPPFEVNSTPEQSLVAEGVSQSPNDGNDTRNPEEAPPISAQTELPEAALPSPPTGLNYGDADRVWKATYCQLLNHPWSTSLILSVLVLLMASVFIQVHQLVTSPPLLADTTSAVVTPIQTKPVVLSRHAVPTIPVSLQRFETPGAGPSKQVQVTTTVASVAATVGEVRHGSATPIPKKRQCAAYKGKGKAIEPPQPILLLEAPTSFEVQVAQSIEVLREKMSSLMDTRLAKTHSSEALVVFDVHRALDLMLSRLLAQTSMILRDLSSLANSARKRAEEIVVAADNLRCSAHKKAAELLDVSQQFAQELLSGPKLQQAHEALKSGRTKAKSKANHLAKTIRTQLRKAKRQSRKDNVGKRILQVRSDMQRQAESMKCAVLKAVAPGLQSASDSTTREMSKVIRKARKQAKKLVSRKFAERDANGAQCHTLGRSPTPLLF